MSGRIGTVLVGFGRIAAGYASDPLTARHYRFATHAQVLSSHPSFRWEAVVDASEEARIEARTEWKVPAVAARVEELEESLRPALAVIATPPAARLEIVERMPSLRAVLVEKPLGRTVAEAERFLEHCRGRGILVAVNYWRRADRLFRDLAAGRLRDLVGEPQAAFGLYGNGLLNNGSHLVDFVRMLLGEVTEATATGPSRTAAPADPEPPFQLRIGNGSLVAVQPLDFGRYREVSLDIWGTTGRLSILNEGLTILHAPGAPHRALEAAREVAADAPVQLESTVGEALYALYENLAAAFGGKEPLASPGDSALRTERLIEAIHDSQERLPDSSIGS